MYRVDFEESFSLSSVHLDWKNIFISSSFIDMMPVIIKVGRVVSMYHEEVAIRFSDI